MQPNASHSQSGFTVLELLVAIAILAAALIPLLTLQQSNTRAALGVERAQARLALDRAALAYLRGLNPAREPQGETDLGEATLAWRAQPLGEEKPIRTLTGAPGRYLLQRYRVNATLRPADAPERRWQVDLLGWRPARPFSTQF